MLRFAADENFDGRILRGLLRVVPDLDLIRVQDTRLAGSDDALVLEWAAHEGRLVLTHDVGTMTAAAWERVRAGLPMPGLLEVRSDTPIGLAIEHIRLVAEISKPGEHEAQVVFLPF